MRKLGVPYKEDYEAEALADLEKQQLAIQASLKNDKLEIPANSEIIALIAYLQRLGTDIKKAPAEGQLTSNQ
jgi:cytochrome c oxidase cbb3-type subunit I/II